MLPDLGGTLSAVKMRPLVCAHCGYVQVFASEEARKKLKTAKHWKLVSD